MNITQAVPFFWVSDMEISLRFYTESLGFTLQNHWTPHGKIEWCWLQREGAALMLQEPRSTPEQPYLDGHRPGAGVSIWFQCTDSLALYQEFLSKNISVNEPFVGNHL